MPRAVSLLCCLGSGCSAGTDPPGPLQTQYRCAPDVQGKMKMNSVGVQGEDKSAGEHTYREGAARSDR